LFAKLKGLILALALLCTGCAAPAGMQPSGAAIQKPVEEMTTAAPSSMATGMRASKLADLGVAPELENSVWINTPRPLRLKDLRGKVVLLEMWTFGCINCQHVLPALKDWQQKYASQGLVIIGNHFPEFDYEKDLTNLKAAVKTDGIVYPVAQDNDGKTWSAYQNQYWPSLYLIDKVGHIRYTHIGEGSYVETEKAIQALLEEPAS
jgi:thiol-disulfide isomerase/thioredoxin